MLLGLSCMLALSCGEHDRAGPKPAPTASPTRRVAEDPAHIVETLAKSAHSGLDCSECHVRQAGVEPSIREIFSKDLTQCSRCHAESSRLYDESVHGMALQRGNADAARCVHCHGSHDILGASDPRSPIHKSNIPKTCGQCHQNPELAKQLGIHQPAGVSHYLDSVHGKMLVERGVDAAPSCVDCHGANHRLRRASDPESTINRANVAKTCGRCHGNKSEEYTEGVHGQALARGDQRAPVCIDCHTSHEITRPDEPFKLASDRLCGKCHDERLKRYYQTYHGRAHDLGSSAVASCYDCHGAHPTFAVSDPRSALSPANRLATCQKCHPGAPPKFADFQAHGDYTDRKNYPLLFWAFVIMTGLIVGTFGVWFIHSFMWMYRTWRVYRADPKRFREEKRHVRQEKPGKTYVRFRPVDRLCHFLIIVSFFILVATGMPLKFHTSHWAQVAFRIMGGARAAAHWHRFGAILSGLYLTIHLLSLVGPLRRRWSSFRDDKRKFRLRRLLGFVFGPDSPLPNWQDVRDAIAHLKWFVGRAERPTFDRFTYWEKFDYFAELWGSMFIGLSGLVMWFPAGFTRVLPGWIVNLAHVIHSQEALLAAGFILTVHFFNSHFRLEKLPLDTVMFSGRVTEAEMKHERGRQWERLKAEGRLAELQAKGVTPRAWTVLTSTFGMAALVLGMVLTVAMIWGLARLWFGG
jgi:cytochrome b subunit of formate dehydrogenase